MARKTYQYRPGGLLLVVLYVLLATSAVILVADAVASGWQWEIQRQIDLAFEFGISEDDWDRLVRQEEQAGEAVQWLFIPEFAIRFATVPFLMVMGYRAAANAHRAAEGLQTVPSLAAWGYIIPFANWVIPYVSLAEYYRAGRGSLDALREGKLERRFKWADWKKASPPLSLRFWWLGRLAAPLGKLGAYRLLEESQVNQDPDQWKTGVLMMVGLSLLHAAACVAGIVFFRELFQLQAAVNAIQTEAASDNAVCPGCGEPLQVDDQLCPVCGAQPGRDETPT